MQVSVETTKGLERKLTVNVPSEKLEQEVDSRLQELAKKVKLDGFRPGKVPVRVVRQRFSASVREEVARDMISSTLQEALTEQDLIPAAMPNIAPGEIAKDADFSYTATFDVFPKIELVELEGQTVEQVEASVADADVDGMLEKLREQNKVFKASDAASEKGDKIKIDFEGFVNDEAFAGGKAEGYELELGSNSMIPGFEEGLEGAKAEQELDLNVTFPESYGHKDLAGKEAVFKIKVHEVLKGQLPEVDEEFVKKFNIESGKLEDLKENILKNMTRELSNQVKMQNKEKVFDAFLKVNPIELPASLVDKEIEVMKKDMINRVFGPDQKPEGQLPNLPREMFEKQAERRVQLGLLVSEYIQKHELKATSEQVDALLEEMSAAYDKPEELKQWYRSNKKQMADLEAIVVEDTVVEKLLALATMENVAKNYDTVMNPPAPEADATEEEEADKE